MPATLTTASSPPCSSTSSRNRSRTAAPSVTDTDEARAEPPGCHDATGCGLLRLPEPLGAVEGYEGIHGDDIPAATAELLRDRRSDPAPAARHDGDLLTRARRCRRPGLEIQAFESAGLEPLLEQLAIAEDVAPPPAVVAVAGVRQFRVTLVVEARRRAGGHHRARVDEGADDLLRPLFLGLGTHVEHVHAPLRELPDDTADELGPEHGQLRVVDGHHRLLPRRRHDEHVREATGHHPEEAGSAVGPLLGQRDTAASDYLVAGASEEWGDLSLEAGPVNDAVDVVLLPVDDRALLADPFDPGRAVDQRDVGFVECQQVLVVEARPLAEIPVVRLEDLGRGGVGHQLLDPSPVRIHDPVVNFLCAPHELGRRHSLRSRGMLNRLRSRASTRRRPRRPRRCGPT